MILNKKSGIRSQRSGVSGFTLIETIITLVVLSIAAVGVLSVFTSGMKGSANPLILSQATQFAQGEMDNIMGQKTASGFGSIVTSPTCSTMLAGFTCNRNVFYVDPAIDLNTQQVGPTNYKHVTVTITQPIIGTMSVDSLITNY
jgi:prepilin-type N-terminal cleavage/methylation domain-containing protein